VDSSFDASDIEWFRIRLENMIDDGDVVYFDNIRTGVNTARAQETVLPATKDLTTLANLYRIAVRSDDVAAIDSIRVWFSDTAGVGTTEPADRMEIVIAGTSLAADDTFYEVEATAAQYGNPDVSIMDCIGVEVTYLGDALPVVWLDDLRVTGAAETGYTGSVGALIESVPDIYRHILITRCGSTDNLNATSWANAFIFLPDSKHGGDLRLLGTTFEEIVQGLAFESRCQLLPLERVGKRNWYLSSAEHTWDFTASSTVLDYDGWDEAGRDVVEIGTEFQALYDYDASESFGEQAFRGIVRADAGQNDTDVPDADLTAARARYGTRAVPPFLFVVTNDLAAVKDAMGFYVQEAIRATRHRYSGVLPAWEAITLELGDVRQINPPNLATAVQARVIGHSYDPSTRMVTLTMEEVKT
jgi:hypothetical protein